MVFLKRHIDIFVVIFLSFWAVKPFFVPGFFPMHDDTQVARVYEMGKALKDGMFPVRWVPDLGYGYGYPIFNFYAPLAYYFGGLLTLFGFDALMSTKIMMIFGIVLAGVFMYLLAREFWGEIGGVLSGLFYVYAPYHALDIYVRGDVAEFWAYAFIPLAFLGIYKRSILIGSIGFAGIILSHSLTALMVTPFLLIVVLLNCYMTSTDKRSLILYHSSLILILGLLISAFYWVPAIFEMKYTNVMSQIGGGADFRDHFVCVSQLWDSLWGFGGSAPNCIDGLSFKIGKLHIVTSLMAIVIAIFVNKIRKGEEGIIVFFAFFGLLLSIFFTLEISKAIWEIIPAMDFFQYPWRFLLLVSFFSSLLAGSLVMLLINLRIKPYLTAFILIFFLLFFNIKLFNPQTIIRKTANDYTNEIALKWTASKISDEYLPPDFRKPKSVKEIAMRPPIKPQDTSLQKISNVASLVGLAMVVIVIISLWKNKRQR